MQPAKVVDGVDIFIEGEGAETIVMIHGWPDTPCGMPRWPS
jgi:hypothetical protein